MLQGMLQRRSGSERVVADVHAHRQRTGCEEAAPTSDRGGKRKSGCNAVVNIAVNLGQSFSLAMASRLFDALDAEWAAVGASAPGQASFRRWAEADPALAPFGSAAEAVRFCRGAAPATAAVVLAALVHRADEPLAARAVLQAVIPSLRVQVVRRTAGMSRQASGQAWESCEDFEADVVEAAVGRIAALAGTRPAWPAQAVCEATWRHLRLRARYTLRMKDNGALPLTAEREELPAGPDLTGADALAMAVAGAVRAQRLRPDDARVIYATRVLGHTPADVAAVVGRDVRAVRAQRSRAEQRLIGAGWAPTLRPTPCNSRGRAQRGRARGVRCLSILSSAHTTGPTATGRHPPRRQRTHRRRDPPAHRRGSGPGPRWAARGAGCRQGGKRH